MKRVGNTGVQGAALAVGVHLALIGYLLASDAPPARQVRRLPPVKMKLVRRSKPPPPAPESKAALAPEPKVAPAPKVEPDRHRIKRERKRRVVKQEQPAEPPKQEQKPRKARRKFSVALDVTVPSGGVAVPSSADGRSGVGGVVEPGGTGGRDAPLTGPARTTPGAGPGVKERKARAVTVAPRLVSAPSPARLRAIYPMEARRAGLEGNVSMKILVSVTGRVTRVRILRRAGSGFDEAARKLARELKFAAGTRDGKPVAVWIPWTYKFRLNG